MRLVKGKCGGKYSKMPKVSKKNKVRPMIAITGGSILFLVSALLVLIYTRLYR